VNRDWASTGANWTEETLPANWQVIRARWAAFHALRTFVSLGAVAAAVGAALTTRTAVQEAPTRGGNDHVHAGT
jgi:hypothetical protein